MRRKLAEQHAPLGQTIKLRDGRALGFLEFGDPTGKPLFFFHGGGSTRLTRHPDDSILDELGVRLITIDRPGVGLSDYQPGRRLLDWPDDTAELADRLQIDRFAVLGWSAGGPHALACAYKIPDRLLAAGVISGLAPLHWPGVAPTVAALRLRLSPLARRCGEVLHQLPGTRIMATRRAAAYGTDLLAASSSHAQGEVPLEIRAINRQRFRDLVRAREWERAIELIMLASPWGFRLQDITMDVHLWYGAQDGTTPLYMATYLSRAIPHARLTVWPGEGHHVGFTHWREVLATLLR